MGEPPRKNKGPQTRSNSQDISLGDICTLISDAKNEILRSLKPDLERLNNNIASLSSKIKTIETRLDNLSQRQTTQATEIETLKLSYESMTTLLPSTILDEVDNRFRRRTNIIIRGLPELEEGSANDRRDHDVTRTNAVLNYLSCDSNIIVKNVTRIGKKRPNGHRLLKIVLPDEDMKRDILQKAKSLRSSSKFADVFISPDLTPQQQNDQKNLQIQLKSRRAEGEDVVIRSGRIQPRSGLQHF